MIKDDKYFSKICQIIKYENHYSQSIKRSKLSHGTLYNICRYIHNGTYLVKKKEPQQGLDNSTITRPYTSPPTAQTFNSCSSQPDDVCQCLVAQTSMDNMSKNKPSAPMTHIACESKQLLIVWSETHGVASMPRKLSGNEACIRVFCSGCLRI